MYSYMCINEYEEESWYGDPNKLSKMISANYPKKFFINLKALQLDSCTKNSLGKEGAKILAEALQPNESIQVLDISSNYIGVTVT
jgi:hypothetical protein